MVETRSVLCLNTNTQTPITEEQSYFLLKIRVNYPCKYGNSFFWLLVYLHSGLKNDQAAVVTLNLLRGTVSPVESKLLNPQRLKSVGLHHSSTKWVTVGDAEWSHSNFSPVVLGKKHPFLIGNHATNGSFPLDGNMNPICILWLE